MVSGGLGLGAEVRVDTRPRNGDPWIGRLWRQNKSEERKQGDTPCLEFTAWTHFVEKTVDFFYFMFLERGRREKGRGKERERTLTRLHA